MKYLLACVLGALFGLAVSALLSKWFRWAESDGVRALKENSPADHIPIQELSSGRAWAVTADGLVLWDDDARALFRFRDVDSVERTIPRENARICNLSWFDDSIYLSDTDFSHCQFIRCKLIDDGGPFSMQDCFMDSCTIRSANDADPQPAHEIAKERQYRNSEKRPLTNRTRED